MPSATITTEKCSKCDGPLDTLDTKAKDNWCRKCRADYQRDYVERRYQEAKAEGYTEGFACGFAECRLYLMQKFNPFPLHSFSGLEVLNTARAATPSNGTANSSSLSKPQDQIPLR